MDPEGRAYIDMSKIDHPYELEQIENLNKIDQAKFFQIELQKLIDSDDFIDEDERKIAHNNMKCLNIYQYQQELRQQVLSNYMTNQIALDHYGCQTLGDIMYTRQLVDREYYKRTKTYNQNKKEARTIDRFEQNMRSGLETRKKARHKEFINEII